MSSLSWVDSIWHGLSARPSELSRSSLAVNYMLCRTQSVLLHCRRHVDDMSVSGGSPYMRVLNFGCYFSASKSWDRLTCRSPYMWKYTVTSTPDDRSIGIDYCQKINEKVGLSPIPMSMIPMSILHTKSIADTGVDTPKVSPILLVPIPIPQY